MEECTNFGDKITKLCLEKYANLPRSGKPQADKEWTLLAGIILEFETEERFKVVSLATGSKCIGPSKMSKKGEVLNDSHAEVLARRGMIRYLYSELYDLYTTGSSEILEWSVNNLCKLKDGIYLHMYTSNTPCGDASIFPKHCNSGPASIFPKHCNSGTSTTQERQINDISTEQAQTVPGIVDKRKVSKIDEDNVCDIQGEKDRPDDGEIQIGESSKVTDCRIGIKRDEAKTTGNKRKTSQKISADESHSVDLTMHDYTSNNNSCYGTIATNPCNTHSYKASYSIHVPSNTFTVKDLPTGAGVDTDGTRTTDMEGCSSSLEVGKRKKAELDNILNTSNKKYKAEIHQSSLSSAGSYNQDCTIFGNTEINQSVTEDTIGDIYRTGAKCVSNGLQDPLGTGVDYHILGAFRIKPGRGERTLSMSCSDKMAKWNVVGCQGALLSHFLSSPIYFTSITIGRCPYSNISINRALVERNSSVTLKLPDGFISHQPKFNFSNLPFMHGKYEVSAKVGESGQARKVVPCSSAITWCLIGDCKALLDVTTHGRKHGVIAKNLDKPQARSQICSKSLFDIFLYLKSCLPTDNLPDTLRNENLKTYKDFKMAAISYQNAWQQLLSVYGTWDHKPLGYLDFQ